MRNAAWAMLFVVMACGGSDDEPGASSGGGSSGQSGASSGGGASGGSSGTGASSGNGGGSSGSSGNGGSSGSSGNVSGDPNGLLPADSIWQSTSEWYRDISAAPVAEHSSEMLDALPQWGNQDNFQIDDSFVVLDGTGAPQVMFPEYDEGDNVPVPVPANGYVEGGSDYSSCEAGDDCHLLIVDRGAARLYEVYHAHFDGESWAGEPTMWKLDKTYPREARGKGCTSADAAGLAITPGLIGYQETKAGHIGHALRLVLKNEFMRRSDSAGSIPNVAYPATHGTKAPASATGVPYGARLRLKASVSDDDPRFTSPGAKSVLKALHTYGMIVADGGNIPLMKENIRVHADADASATWEGLLENQDLSGLEPSDFEVIGIPKDHPGGEAGFYSTRADYEGQLQTPLGCDGIVQP